MWCEDEVMAVVTREYPALREVSGRSSTMVLRSLSMVCGIALGVVALLSAAVLLTDRASTSPLPTDLMLITASLVLAVRIARGRLSWGEIAGLLVITVAASLYAPFSVLAQFVGPAVTAVLLLAVVVSIQGRPALVLGICLTIASVVVILQWSGRGWQAAATMGALQLGMLTAAWAVVNALFRAVTTSDALATQLRDAELRTRVVEAQHASQETIRRVLHDDVLTALRSVAEPVAVANTSVDAPSRKACRDAARAIRELTADRLIDPADAAHVRVDGPQASATASGLGGLIVEGLPLTVSTHTLAGPSPAPSVARALALSAREALRNVGRHAGVNEATLTVDFSVGGAEVRVSDRGSGFSVREATLGMGISSSIMSRMEEVGGSATLRSGDGSGSTWTLRGPVGPLASEVTMMNENTGHDFLTTEKRRLALGLTIPMLAANLFVAILYVPSNRLFAVEVLVALAMTASTVAAAMLVVRKALGRAVISVFGTLQAMLLLVHMWGAGPGAASDFRSWGSSLGALPLILLAFFVTSPAALAVLVLPYATVLGFVVARDPVASLTSSLGFLSAVTTTVTSWLLGTALRRSWRQVEEQRHQVHLAQVTDVRRSSVEEVKDQYLSRAIETVLPLLEAVSSGRSNLDAADIRAEAAQLSLATRDDLYAPGFFPLDLRQEVAEFRRNGGVVDVRPGFPPGPGQGPAGALLQALVRDRVGARRVILTYLTGEDRGVRVVVVPPLSEDEMASLSRAHGLESAAVGGDEFVSWLFLTDPHK
ncbi:hypothetical protein BA895_19860 [Humibacillus sp. DSM 29435]|nr:hypothetical protein BA895_19860 [Humibacillus sp. DSM 29435]